MSRFGDVISLRWHVMKLEWCLINLQMPLDMLGTIILGWWSRIADIHMDLQETMSATFREHGGHLEKHVKYLHYNWQHPPVYNNIYFPISIAQWLRFLLFGPVIRFLFHCKCVCLPNLSMKSNAGSVVGSLPIFLVIITIDLAILLTSTAPSM